MSTLKYDFDATNAEFPWKMHRAAYQSVKSRTVHSDDVMEAYGMCASLSSSDPDALEHAIANSYPAVYRFIQRCVGDHELASDLTQNVMLRLWQKRDTVDWNASILPWLYVVARHEMADWWREDGRHDRSCTSLDDPSRLIAYLADNRHGNDIDLTSEQAIFIVDFNRALNRLSVQDVMVLRLRFVNGQSSRQVAVATCLSEANVDQRACRAQRVIRRATA